MSRNELLKLDVGQANEIKLAFRREGGWNSGDIKILCERRGLLRKVLAVLRGVGEIKLPGNIIDFEAMPSVPEGSILIWEEEIFPCGGLGVFKPSQVTVRKIREDNFNHRKNATCWGDVRKAMVHRFPFGAQLLDLYVENPELASPEMKDPDTVLCFWGSLFADPAKHAYIRTLTWNGTRWHEDRLYMDHPFAFADSSYVSLMFC